MSDVHAKLEDAVQKLKSSFSNNENNDTNLSNQVDIVKGMICKNINDLMPKMDTLKNAQMEQLNVYCYEVRGLDSAGTTKTATKMDPQQKSIKQQIADNIFKYYDLYKGVHSE